jgi:hypothetical protein
MGRGCQPSVAVSKIAGSNTLASNGWLMCYGPSMTLADGFAIAGFVLFVIGLLMIVFTVYGGVPRSKSDRIALSLALFFWLLIVSLLLLPKLTGKVGF